MRDHVIVAGGSLTGLITARILTAHFRRVTVVERDQYPATPVTRRGLPQSQHIHFLLDRGRQVLERLFPTFAADLAAAGGETFNYGRDARILTAAGWLPPFESALTVRACTRPLIDWLVVQYLAAMPQVELCTGWEVLRPLIREGRVSGAVLQSGEVRRELAADLLVDAGGRLSRAPEWLEEMGYARPPELVVDSHLTYCSRYYERPPGPERDWRMLSCLPRPPHAPRSGVIFPVEGGRWIACLATMGDDTLPATDEGFLAFAASLPSPEIHEALRRATPLSPVLKRVRTPNRLRRFEALRRFPDGLVVLGDAVCALNPSYGQGITVGALGADLLGAELMGAGPDLRGLGRRFQRKLADQNRAAWNLATGSDLAWPGTESNFPGWYQRLVRWGQPVSRVMAQRLAQGAVADPAVARALFTAMHMSGSLLGLLRPGVLRSIVWAKEAPAPKLVGRAKAAL
jgi:2-polyprenyl-6-methoxyphenol hydroxylase-like FAD-dependent oxidoreductase